jgi:hypothetical protein
VQKRVPTVTEAKGRGRELPQNLRGT